VSRLTIFRRKLNTLRVGNAEGISRPLAGPLLENPCVRGAIFTMICTNFSNSDAHSVSSRPELLRRSPSFLRLGSGVGSRWSPRMLQTTKEESETYPLDHLLADLQRQRFFGSIELKLEAGHVVLIRKTETIKPAHDHRDNRRTEYERRS